VGGLDVETSCASEHVVKLKENAKALSLDKPFPLLKPETGDEMKPNSSSKSVLSDEFVVTTKPSKRSLMQRSSSVVVLGTRDIAGGIDVETSCASEKVARVKENAETRSPDKPSTKSLELLKPETSDEKKPNLSLKSILSGESVKTTKPSKRLLMQRSSSVAGLENSTYVEALTWENSFLATKDGVSGVHECRVEETKSSGLMSKGDLITSKGESKSMDDNATSTSMKPCSITSVQAVDANSSGNTLSRKLPPKGMLQRSALVAVLGGDSNGNGLEYGIGMAKLNTQQNNKSMIRLVQSNEPARLMLEEACMLLSLLRTWI
jgi:hypothetical protein